MERHYDPSTGVYSSPRAPVDLPVHSESLPQLLLSIASSHNAPAFIDSCTGRQILSSELKERCFSLAEGFRCLGIARGDVVMLLAPNSIDYPVVLLSVMILGAAITTANPVNTRHEVEKQAKDSKAKLVVTVAQLFEKVSKLGLPVVLMDADQDDKLLQLSSGSSIEVVSMQHLFRRDLEELVRVAADDTAAVLYSSGTTGASKGVLISHRNVIAASLIHSGACPKPIANEVHLCVIPMFHIYGFVVIICAQLNRKVPVVVMPRFDFEAMLGNIQRYQVTHCPIVPPVITALSKSSLVAKYDLSSLVEIGSGAAPLRQEVIDACIQRLPWTYIKQGYGLTESTAIASVAIPGELEHCASAGVLCPNTLAKVVDPETGRPLPPRKHGEIWLQGPTIMQGYLNSPKATAETVDKNGWLHTGDLGYIDEGGNIYVVDRIKELIKYKGFQVAPAELEALLLMHPHILDAAVVPFPDEQAGEIPLAAIVRRPGSNVDEASIKSFIADQVAPYKRIRRVMFLAAIPKLASGKILRRELVQTSTARL